MEKSKVQKLYDSCELIFAQKDLPTFEQIQSLRNLLDSFEAVDVGIGSRSPSPERNKESIFRPEITYIHIHECDHFSIGIFCFPAGAALPLHDHPGMTVLTKLLYGSVYVKAYDWVKDLKVQKSRSMTSVGVVGVARKVVDGIMRAPSEPSILYPNSGGNIHTFTALTPCAILDVLSPPYSQELGRNSTYFSEFPILTVPGFSVLQEKELPDDLVVVGAPYLGPCIRYEK